MAIDGAVVAPSLFAAEQEYSPADMRVLESTLKRLPDTRIPSPGRLRMPAPCSDGKCEVRSILVCVILRVVLLQVNISAIYVRPN